MLSIASGFQYSVNIAFDLNKDDKIRNYIPTQTAIDFAKEILSSMQENSTERARVLVGAYGKGKSHMVLTTLSLLMQKDKALFNNLWRADTSGDLEACVYYYYAHNKKILPVIISGSNTSLNQAFIVSLQRALVDNDLLDLMPETNYQAAVNCIERWRTEYPAVYKQLKEKLAKPMDVFVNSLCEYNLEAYKQFEEIYPELTAGATFNPFLGFEVVDLYENVAKALQEKGYAGIYLIYDEFSKYLEANIAEASVSDIKMLQDFAEKCNRSGSLQLHILLICHKEIANYIDILPKEKTDGWRGVSERFKHIQLTNHFSQIYEIIEQVIQKDAVKWNEFCYSQQKMFHSLYEDYVSTKTFTDVSKTKLSMVLQNCYPLHPASLFLLPRLAEKIAQNERTLFTFLSAEGRFTMPSFIANAADEKAFILPDVIYDYFQPLMQKDLYTGEIHQQYLLSTAILDLLPIDSLEAKMVKFLSLIYMVAELDKFSPTEENLQTAYKVMYNSAEIATALQNLKQQNYLLRLQRNNGFLRLKESSGVDINQKIQDKMASLEHSISAKDILNGMNFDAYIYPARYNDTREMTRYFRFEFIDGYEVRLDTNWTIKANANLADGVIYGIIPRSEAELAKLHKVVKDISAENIVFVLPKNYTDITNTALKLYAINALKDDSLNDRVLYSEYEILYDDLFEVVNNYIRGFMRPETYQAYYFYLGQQKNIYRKAQFSDLTSDIMAKIYSKTPVINNEGINQNEPTKPAIASRAKVIAGLLRDNLEYNLGLHGNGQDVAIFRSTILRTGIVIQDEQNVALNLTTTKNYELAEILHNIENILCGECAKKKTSFKEIYEYLLSPKHHIGMRRGIIPIYLAVVLHKCKRELIFFAHSGEVELNAVLLEQINQTPEKFYWKYIPFDAERENYIHSLKHLFIDYVPNYAGDENIYLSVYEAMNSWYRALPRYSKNIAQDCYGQKITREQKRFLALLRIGSSSARAFLCSELSKLFAAGEDYELLLQQINNTKMWYEARIDELVTYLSWELKKIFSENVDTRTSLVSLFSIWQEKLNKGILQQIFSDNTHEFLRIISKASEDEKALIDNLAFFATGLKINDWSEAECKIFIAKMAECKATAESFQAQIDEYNTVEDSGIYEVHFVSSQANNIRRFDKISYNARGKRLFNSLLARLDEAGQGISAAEKRQIVMDVLEKII